jgi:hypothetical protein
MLGAIEENIGETLEFYLEIRVKRYPPQRI